MIVTPLLMWTTYGWRKVKTEDLGDMLRFKDRVSMIASRGNEDCHPQYISGAIFSVSGLSDAILLLCQLA